MAVQGSGQSPSLRRASPRWIVSSPPHLLLASSSLPRLPSFACRLRPASSSSPLRPPSPAAASPRASSRALPQSRA